MLIARNTTGGRSPPGSSPKAKNAAAAQATAASTVTMRSVVRGTHFFTDNASLLKAEDITGSGSGPASAGKRHPAGALTMGISRSGKEKAEHPQTGA